MSKHSFLNDTNISRGIRNNNPLNLIKTSIAWQGKIPHKDSMDLRFEQFDTIENGIRAGAIDIIGDIAKDGKNTLVKLIGEFAPSFENNTTGYIQSVARFCGITANEKIPLSEQFLFLLVKAMINVENGNHAKRVTNEMISAGISSINAGAKAMIKSYKI